MRLFKMGYSVVGNPGSDEVVEYSEAKLDERCLEDILAEHVEMLDPDLCVIGRQVRTDGGRLDLLVIDKRGDIVVIEMKRGLAARNVTRQVLDYGRWIEKLNYDELNDIAKKHVGGCADLRGLLQSKFGTVPEAWNERHRMYIIAPEFDEKTIDAVDYLIRSGVAVNCVMFNVCIHNAERFVGVSFVFNL